MSINRCGSTLGEFPPNLVVDRPNVTQNTDERKWHIGAKKSLLWPSICAKMCFWPTLPLPSRLGRGHPFSPHTPPHLAPQFSSLWCSRHGTRGIAHQQFFSITAPVNKLDCVLITYVILCTSYQHRYIVYCRTRTSEANQANDCG